MKNFLKKILRFPFQLLQRITLGGESLLWRFTNIALDDDTKLRLSRQTVIDLVGRRHPEKRFKIGSYVNALDDASPLAERFAANLIDNLVLFESQLGQDCLVDTILEGKEAGVFVE